MPETSKDKENGSGAAVEDQWPRIDSRFRLVVVAAQRSKQLVRGARPRVEANPQKRRNTSIALEEVKRGLVTFTDSKMAPEDNADAEAGRVG